DRGPEADGAHRVALAYAQCSGLEARPHQRAVEHLDRRRTHLGEQRVALPVVVWEPCAIPDRNAVGKLLVELSSGVRILVGHRDLKAEVRGGQRRRQSAGTRADDDEIGLALEAHWISAAFSNRVGSVTRMPSATSVMQARTVRPSTFTMQSKQTPIAQ